jgi:hypothetical protein
MTLLTIVTGPSRVLTRPSRARHRRPARPLHQVLPPRSMLLFAVLATALAVLLVAAG